MTISFGNRSQLVEFQLMFGSAIETYLFNYRTKMKQISSSSRKLQLCISLKLPGLYPQALSWHATDIIPSTISLKQDLQLLRTNISRQTQIFSFARTWFRLSMEAIQMGHNRAGQHRSAAVYLRIHAITYRSRGRAQSHTYNNNLYRAGTLIFLK